MSRPNYYTYRLTLANRKKVQATRNDTGTNREGKLDYPQSKAKRLATLHEALFGTEGASDKIQELGEALFSVLFDDALKADFLQFYESFFYDEGTLLRLELDIDEQECPDLVDLPWEFLKVPHNAISPPFALATAPRMILSRHLRRWNPIPAIRLPRGERVRIALVVAQPQRDAQGAALSKVAYKEVWEELQRLGETQKSEIEVLGIVEHATRDALDTLLETQRPHILHFIGRTRLGKQAGRTIEEVAIVGENGREDWVPASDFGTLLQRHRPAMVLFQTGGPQAGSAAGPLVSLAAQAMAQNIPVAVGMRYPLSPDRAKQFACEFYRRLAQECPVDQAVQEARRKIDDFSRNPDFASPVLFMRVKDGRLFERGQAPALLPPKTEQLRRALNRLDYTDQTTNFRKIYPKPQRMVALVISGRSGTGQRWLLNRLLYEKLPRSNPAEPLHIGLDIGNTIFSQDIDSLWQAVAERVGVPWDSGQTEAVAHALHTACQEQNVLIVLHNVTELDADYAQGVLAHFWQPLVAARGEAAPPPNWLLLFMVDNSGELMQATLEVTPLSQAGWEPTSPVQLVPLPARFDAAELENWLWNQDNWELDPLRERVDEDAEALLAEILRETKKGVPELVLRKVCHLCDHKWNDLKGKWYRL